MKVHSRIVWAVLLMLSSSIGNSFPKDNLTPLGAELLGNSDGSIPRWQGESSNTVQLNNEIIEGKPLYNITNSNIDEYKSVLPYGLFALVKKYPESMRVPVYKSYRPAYFPDWIYDAIEKNATSAELVNNGEAVTNTYPGIPFPMAKNGYEVLWNHKLAYRGVYLESGTSEKVIHENRQSQSIRTKVKYAMSYYDKDRAISDLEQMLGYYISSVTHPPKLSGGGLLVHERVNGSVIPRQAWGYMAGQRRIIRIPSVDYDSLMPRSEGIRFADEVDIYNGSINRYDWRLVGKKELIIPYNNGALYDDIRFRDLLDKDFYTKFHPNPKYLRYEKHRVWMVEGILKTGESHPYKKRVLYMEEDSWIIVLAENYKKNNELWRVSVSYVKFYQDLGAVFKVADIFHDIEQKSYFAQSVDGRKKTVIKTTLPSKQMFKPSALRRLGRR